MSRWQSGSSKVIDRTSQAELADELRKLLLAKGEPMEAEGQSRYYGWRDHEAIEHHRETGCEWVVPEQAPITERWLTEFTDTFPLEGEDGDRTTTGLEVDGASCSCGHWSGTLRWTGNLAEVIRELDKAKVPAKVYKV